MKALLTKHDRKALSNRRRPEEIDAIVLDLLRQANGPLSAYEIAAYAIQHGHMIVPNQVYRTLARLIDEGLALKIKSLSAFIARSGPADLIMICDDCRAYAFLEAPKIVSDLQSLARARGFIAFDPLIEVSGFCDGCSTGRNAQWMDDNSAV